METGSGNRRETLQPLAAVALAAAALALPKAPPATAADIDVDKIPAKVMKAADRVLKGIKWTSAATHSEEKEQDIYELFGDDAKGMSVSAEVSAEGLLTSGVVASAS